MVKEDRNLSDEIEQDFLDAIERIQNGRPRNSKHKEWLASKGKVPLNISTVAREAGRARGLIASKNAKYQGIRDRIHEVASSPVAEPKNKHDVIADLRKQILELRLEVKTHREYSAYHFKKRSEAEALLEECRERNKRLLRKLGTGSVEGGIVQLYRPDG